eukprot:6723900-Prymnesium_polylepis.1
MRHVGTSAHHHAAHAARVQRRLLEAAPLPPRHALVRGVPRGARAAPWGWRADRSAAAGARSRRWRASPAWRPPSSRSPPAPTRWRHWAPTSRARPAAPPATLPCRVRAARLRRAPRRPPAPPRRRARTARELRERDRRRVRHGLSARTLPVRAHTAHAPKR